MENEDEVRFDDGFGLFLIMRVVSCLWEYPSGFNNTTWPENLDTTFRKWYLSWTLDT